MKKAIALVLSLLPVSAVAVSFDADVRGVRQAVQASKDKEFSAEVTRLIETLRDSRERSPKMNAVSKLEDIFSSQTYLDRHRIVDALAQAGRDNDRAMRHAPIRALGRIGERSGRHVDGMADKIADLLIQRLHETKIPSGLDERSEREDLIAAFAETSASADPMRGDNAERYLDAVMQELRDGAHAGDRGKSTAMLAFSSYAGNSFYRLSSGKMSLLERAANELVNYADQNAGAFQHGDDTDAAFRFSYSRTLLLLSGSRHNTFIMQPALRQRIKDRLERMYQDETSQNLKNYIGLHIGRSIIR